MLRRLPSQYTDLTLGPACLNQQGALHEVPHYRAEEPQ